MREYWLYGLFFALVTPLQLGWAELVRRRPADLRLLAAGAAGNLAVACLWAASRTTGLPVGRERFEPEVPGVKDVLATLDELAVAGLVALILLRRAPAGLASAAWVLVAVSVVAALIGGH